MDAKAREELVEMVAEAAYMALRDFKSSTWAELEPCVPGSLGERVKDRHRIVARAAIAVIEPVVRERCAKVADGAVDHLEWHVKTAIAQRIAAIRAQGEK